MFVRGGWFLAPAGVKKKFSVTVTGRVQGVGFRPAVFRTAS